MFDDIIIGKKKECVMCVMSREVFESLPQWVDQIKDGTYRYSYSKGSKNYGICIKIEGSDKTIIINRITD
jgi:hypothetical protein